MTTLILVGNSEGVVGRCDSRCYEATEPRCTCICDGRNHGKGLEQALRNTAAIVDPPHELRDQMLRLGGQYVTIPPVPTAIQSPLPLD